MKRVFGWALLVGVLGTLLALRAKAPAAGVRKPEPRTEKRTAQIDITRQVEQFSKDASSASKKTN